MVADPVMLIPITPFDEVAAEAVRLPIKLLKSVNVLEASAVVTVTPLTIDPAAVPLRSKILFLEITAVSAAVEIPITAVPPEVIVLITFPEAVIVA